MKLIEADVGRTTSLTYSPKWACVRLVGRNHFSALIYHLLSLSNHSFICFPPFSQLYALIDVQFDILAVPIYTYSTYLLMWRLRQHKTQMLIIAHENRKAYIIFLTHSNNANSQLSYILTAMVESCENCG